jgi:hypothetical protein
MAEPDDDAARAGPNVRADQSLYLSRNDGDAIAANIAALIDGQRRLAALVRSLALAVGTPHMVHDYDAIIEQAEALAALLAQRPQAPMESALPRSVSDGE